MTDSSSFETTVNELISKLKSARSRLQHSTVEIGHYTAALRQLNGYMLDGNIPPLAPGSAFARDCRSRTPKTT